MTNSFPLLAIPWHIQHEVFEYMDLVSRFSMRQCSKRMRRIVNECEPCYESILMSLGRNEVEMTLITHSGQEAEINYRREAVGSDVVCVSGENDIQRMAIDFCGIVANPRVTVDLLTVGIPLLTVCRNAIPYPEEAFRRDVRVLLQLIVKQMKVLGEQMKVKSLWNRVETPQKEIMTLLSVIKAGFLEKMELLLCREETLDRVTTTEQWNRAREVDLMNTRRGMPLRSFIDNPHKVPIEKLLHFRKVTIRCRWLTIEEAEKIVEAAIRQGDEFISFHIGACSTTQTTRDLIRQLINRQNPDSQLEIRISYEAFHVDRKQYIEN